MFEQQALEGHGASLLDYACFCLCKYGL